MKKTVIKALVKNSIGKFLMIYRGDTHPRFPGHLDLPGGNLDNQESEIEAVVREISEETTLVVDSTKLTKAFVKSYEHVDHILYIAQINENDPQITLSWEHSGYKWFTKEELLKEIVPADADPYYLDVLEYLKATPGL